MSNENIVIGYSQKDNNFTIYENKNLLGVFGIINVIKYITSKESNDFLSSVEYESFVNVIEKFLCKIENNFSNDIKIIGYLDSPITGNIEIMMKIYKDISDFNKNILPNEIEKISNQQVKNNLLKIIKNLEYQILNHSLKLIVNISNAIKNNENKKDLKTSLIKYSMFINTKINNIISDNLNETKKEIKTINEEINQIKNIKLI